MLIRPRPGLLSLREPIGRNLSRFLERHPTKPCSVRSDAYFLSQSARELL